MNDKICIYGAMGGACFIALWLSYVHLNRSSGTCKGIEQDLA
jgi:hypothetical protein